jgi:hypothetical protein
MAPSGMEEKITVLLFFLSFPLFLRRLPAHRRTTP